MPESSSSELLVQLARRCLAVFDVAAAAVLLVSPGEPVRVAAATSPGCHALASFAAATETGPGVEALRTGAQVSSPHIDRDTAAWPGYGAAARRAGFRSAQALPLRSGRRVVGALYLFDIRTRSFDADQRALGQAIADDTTTAWVHHDATHARLRASRSS